MIPLILRRLAQLPLILGVIFTITLALAWAVPGNPLENPERRPPPEIAEAMKRQYNLDSFWRFYGSYLDSASGVKFVRESLESKPTKASGESTRWVFDLGPSLRHRDRRVNEIIADSLPVSMTLGAAAIVFALIIGVGAGVLGAIRPNGVLDALTLTVALVGISLPSFVIGTVLLLVFAVWLAWLPVGEWGTLRSLVLPAITLGLPPAAYIARLTRLGMIEQLSMDYIRTARAKGASEHVVVLRHALKNAFLPVLSYLGPATAFAMTGSFVVERVFNVPGMGKHFVNGVQNKDLFLIIGVVLVFATLLILLNLLVDVLYRWVDPRIE
jgi:oligopeptide transport system permease protein